jgi:sulfite exporter TauE/SafE/copper chaperone CopZ
MHCASCDILVKMKLGEMKNIIDVAPDFAKKQAVITHKDQLSLAEINSVLCEYGYSVSSVAGAIKTDANLEKVYGPTNNTNNLQETLGIAAILAIVYFFAKQSGILPDNLTGAGTSIGGAFILGLIASVSTCMATTGALFTSFVNKQVKTNTLQVALLFMLGRVVSYGVFGYILGLFGSLFLGIVHLGSSFSFVIAIILVLVGLDMLQIISLHGVLSRIPGGKLILALQEKKYASNRVGVIAAILGGLTYLLPCGFTLSTQAYALSLGNPLQSSLLMIAFALGTLPALGFVTILSHLRTLSIYQYFLKVVAILIVGVGLSYMVNTAQLYGFSFGQSTAQDPAESLAPIENGKQVVKMTAQSSGYSPSQFTVKVGIPVRWEIEGKEIFSCAGTIQAPGAGVPLTNLKEGENVLEFTPTKTGDINFSCSMGMFSGRFKVI